MIVKNSDKLSITAVRETSEHNDCPAHVQLTLMIKYKYSRVKYEITSTVWTNCDHRIYNIYNTSMIEHIRPSDRLYEDTMRKT